MKHLEVISLQYRIQNYINNTELLNKKYRIINSIEF